MRSPLAVGPDLGRSVREALQAVPDGWAKDTAITVADRLTHSEEETPAGVAQLTRRLEELMDRLVAVAPPVRHTGNMPAMLARQMDEWDWLDDLNWALCAVPDHGPSERLERRRGLDWDADGRRCWPADGHVPAWMNPPVPSPSRAKAAAAMAARGFGPLPADWTP
ncbi:hypothetical protein C0Z10_09420 [Acidipropionibacterium jensenii]|uniref:Uncharacterized protein n=1 Tax=Acidipropionibacterium jensenii TaxID=1749 RepID=A0A3Q9UK05_9ACTN|nr:hypothetical protein [Acidipropionibacterium jensenii]AZZ39934.1 hypothetical protein C0Z10_09420 [Acidipropionibacterium jensenii]